MKTEPRIYWKMCACRYFEEKVAELYDKHIIKIPIYLSVGQEAIPAALSEKLRGYYIFAQHRAHSTYLCFGGDAERLADELLGLPTGCTVGHGGSPMIQDTIINMVGHHGFIGENVPLAVGFALATKKKTVCFFGDGAAEEDYVSAAMGFAATHKLPVLFVCEDNGLSILTEKEVRRSWRMVDVAKAYGLKAVDIQDDPLEILATIPGLPGFMNIHTCRHLWHSGTGNDGPPIQDRLSLFRQHFRSAEIPQTLENEAKAWVDELWQRRLLKLSIDSLAST